MGIAYDVLELQEHATNMAEELKGVIDGGDKEKAKSVLDKYQEFMSKVNSRDWPSDRMVDGVYVQPVRG